MTSPIVNFWFDCIYEEPTSIKWLMDQDWIFDYGEYVKMPLVELETLKERLKIECSTSINEFNSKCKAHKKAYFEEERDKIDKLRHKIISLSHLIGFFKGEIDFVFPDGYQSEIAVMGSSDTASVS